MKTKAKTQSGGYTIIETMISLVLFVIIIVAGMSALLNASVVHQKSQDMRSIIDSLSFIMEDISRNLRTGYNFHCIDVDDFSLATLNTAKSGSNCWGIAFESEYGTVSNQSDQWVYFVTNGKLNKATNAPYTNPLTDPLSGFTHLNPPEVIISSISGFSVLGAPKPLADVQQPFVIIKLSGTITYKNVVTPFSLQTSASQRLIDI